MRTIVFLAYLVVCVALSNYALAEKSWRGEYSERRVRLGVIVPLSGPLAFFGNDYVRAYELIKADHPEVEKSIDLFWEDSAYDNKQALLAFNKLVAINKVDLVFSFGGPMLNALAPVAEARKIPFFATESERRDCEGKAYCTLVRNEEDEWGKATWHMLRKQGKRNIGIIKNQTQFMNTFVNAIVRNKSDDENAEVLLDIPPHISELRSNVLSLRAKNIDALGLYLLPTSHHGFLEASRNVPKTFSLFGVEELLSKENNKGFEDFIEGAFVIAPYATQTYRKQFEQAYGPSAGFYYTPAFRDFISLLEDTVSSQGALRGLQLVDALRFKGEREGVSGRYSVKRSKDGVYSYSFPIAVYKVSKNGVTVEDVFSLDERGQ